VFARIILEVDIIFDALQRRRNFLSRGVLRRIVKKIGDNREIRVGEEYLSSMVSDALFCLWIL
jgi:hypothetical protein